MPQLLLVLTCFAGTYLLTYFAVGNGVRTQPAIDPCVATAGARERAGPNGQRGDRRRIDRRLDPRVGPLHRDTAWLGVGLCQGGPNCLLTHVRPPMPSPTPTLRRGGWERVRRHRRAGGSLGPPPRVSVNLVPLPLTGVRHHPPGRTDKTLCRCFGAPACRVFSAHLLTRGERFSRPRSVPSAPPTSKSDADAPLAA